MEFDLAVDRHLTAIGARDVDAYLATVHDDVSMVLPDGTLLNGRAAVGAFHRDWFADPDWAWELDLTHSARVGDTGLVVYTVDYHDLDADQKPYSMRYLLSLVFTRVGGDWLLLHDQNTK